MKRRLILFLLPILIVGGFVGFIVMTIMQIAGIHSNEIAKGGTAFQPTTQIEMNAKEVFDDVIAKGGTPEFACAWLGNFEAESGIRPDRIQSDLAFNKSIAYSNAGGYAFGLGQMDGGRRASMLRYADEQGKDWRIIPLQMDYMWNHDGSDSTLIQTLSKQTNVEQTAIDILQKWERAGTKDNPSEQAVRKLAARSWYSRLVEGVGFEGGTGTENGGMASGETIPDSYKNLVKHALPNQQAMRTGYPGNGYYLGNCTWYVYNRFAQLGKHIYAYLGDGGSWGRTANANGSRTSLTPTQHWAVSFPPYSMPGLNEYGHVAYVEYVNSDGSFLISEMNVRGEYSMNWRVITAQQAKDAGLVFVSPQN
ncbi:phage tail tip lysozyme [Enterococcus plantarum]|nr:phage tail tip lysozyme [Enterococcus plantarum]